MTKRIVILGGGESGCGSAVLAKVKGFDVFLSDSGKISEKYKNLLIDREIEFEEGVHTQEKILNAVEIIKSPGIPDKATIIRKAKLKNIPVISEIEFASRYTNAKTICITGSNGKTTTTTLIYEILRNTGINVGLAGNIGASYAFQVATTEKDWYVIELSSFQLDGMFDFKADIGLLLNITPDHMDRYDYNIQNYINSKFRIMQNQGENDYFIYCLDDPMTMDNIKTYEKGSKLLSFSVKSSNASAYLNKDIILVSVGQKTIGLERKKIALEGLHNVYNIMAASMAAIAAGVNEKTIKETVYGFHGVEHRLEKVAEKNGILYINDSKATNIDSVWYALEAMSRPIIWIAGGTDKGNDYSPLLELAKNKVKALVCMGLDNSKLINAFEEIIHNIVSTDSIDKAVNAAQRLAKPGDVVLLSPACASFDLFKNYESRGKKFKEEVKKIQIWQDV